MRSFFFLIVAVFLPSCYSVKQAYHFTTLYFSKVPVEKAITNDDIDKKYRDRLAQLPEILEFAAKEGLNVEGAYVDYIHSSSGSVSHLVASRLDQLMGCFPLVHAVKRRFDVG